jgi:EAL domain-containing protein (putative c-di-GMP-specific phosphodiesterase class I)
MMSDRLLILDDEPAIGQTVSMIAQRAGLQAKYCHAPDQFFHAIGKWAPTHIMIDLVMPAVDGVEVLSRLAQAKVRAGVIITSGLGGRVLQSAERAARARGLSVLGVLPKPFSAQALRVLLSLKPVGHPVPAIGLREDAPAAEELDRALECNEFMLVYQPKWMLAERRVLGFEALLRWAHPTRGTLRPDSFIALAERTDRIGRLTDVVLAMSLRWLAAVNANRRVCLEVNISGATVAASLPDQLSQLCDDARVQRDRIVLEVTETSQVCDTLGATDVLNRLRIKGFGLAIDDFGIGYSSMSQLATFPFTELKIDKSFVTDMHRSGEMRSIVRSTITLARKMGLTTVAEGVEDRDTVDLLARMGCDAVQGYAIARPMRPERTHSWLKECH